MPFGAYKLKRSEPMRIRPQDPKDRDVLLKQLKDLGAMSLRVEGSRGFVEGPLIERWEADTEVSATGSDSDVRDVWVAFGADVPEMLGCTDGRALLDKAFQLARTRGSPDCRVVLREDEAPAVSQGKPS